MHCARTLPRGRSSPRANSADSGRMGRGANRLGRPCLSARPPPCLRVQQPRRLPEQRRQPWARRPQERRCHGRLRARHGGGRGRILHARRPKQASQCSLRRQVLRAQNIWSWIPHQNLTTLWTELAPTAPHFHCKFITHRSSGRLPGRIERPNLSDTSGSARANFPRLRAASLRRYGVQHEDKFADAKTFQNFLRKNPGVS